MPDENPSSLDPRKKSMSQLPTSDIKLSKSFLSELELVAPKKRWSKAWLLLPIVILSGGAWLTFTAKGRAIIARVRHTEAATATASETPSASVDVSITSATASVTASASATEMPSAAVSVAASASVAPSASASAKPWMRRRKPR